MLKAYKFRIYPTKSQRTKMEQTLDLCRWTYNQTLAYRKNAWEKEGKSISKYETHNLLPTWKEMKPELCGVFFPNPPECPRKGGSRLESVLTKSQSR